MGVARWSIVRVDRGASRESRALVGLIALCLAYPFYTHVFGGHAIELAGNLVTFAVASSLAFAMRRDRLACALVATVALWVAFATVLVGALVRLNGWA